MNLKWMTTIFLATGFAALVAWPMLLAARPEPAAPRGERRAFAIRLVAVAGIGTLSVAGATISSILLVRRAREEFRLASRRNVESLVSSLARPGDDDEAR